MTNSQLATAKILQNRISELIKLEYLLNLKSQDKIFIKYFREDIEIPEHSKEVILALCIKEREKLEKEFENL